MQDVRGLRGRDTRLAIALFILSSSVYFATITGVTSSNDGSHYALVRALVEDQSFEISPYLEFTENQDYALNGDRRFSDRPPGTALLAAPLYALGGIGPHPLVEPPSKHDAHNPRWLYAVAFSAMAGAGTISLFFLILREFWEIPQPVALLTSFVLAFGTTMWKYSSVLFSHAAAALIIWATLYFVLRFEPDGSQRARIFFLLGLLIGFAPLIEYTNVLFSGIVGLYVLWQWWQRRQRETAWRTLLPLAAGAVIPVVFLLSYDTVNFGSPFEISTFNADTVRWPQNEGLAADFATPLPEGLGALLVYGPQPEQGFYNQGLLLLMPVTLLVLPGLWYFWQGASRRHFALTMGLFVTYLLLFAKSTTYNAATNDGRYLTPFLGLLLVPVAFFLAGLWKTNNPSQLGQLSLRLLVFALIFLSVQNQVWHIVFSWNYNLTPAQFQSFAASPANMGLLWGTVFRNALNLPLLWVGEGLVLLFWCLARRGQQAVSEAQSTFNPARG